MKESVRFILGVLVFLVIFIGIKFYDLPIFYGEKYYSVDKMALAEKVQIINGEEYVEYNNLGFFLGIVADEKDCIMFENADYNNGKNFVKVDYIFRSGDKKKLPDDYRKRDMNSQEIKNALTDDINVTVNINANDGSYINKDGYGYVKIDALNEFIGMKSRELSLKDSIIYHWNS